MDNELGISEYELACWIDTFGSSPVERVAHQDDSQPYESDMAHVFRLENGQFAVVVESGYSCYDSRDAEIELFPDEESAMQSFDKWKKRNYLQPTED